MRRNTASVSNSDFAAAVREHAGGRFAAAERQCRTILRRAPNHSGALVLLAVVLCTTGEPERRREAIALLRRALARDPRNVQTLDLLGDALTAEGDPAGAIAAYRAALDAAPDQVKLYSKLGIALSDSGCHAEAIASYRRALARDPDAAQVYFNLGVALADAGDDDGAIEAYRAAIVRRPAEPDAYINLGAIYARLARRSDALEAFHAAADCAPADPGRCLKIALALRDLGACDRALTLTSTVVRAAPDLPEGPLALGTILLMLERFAEARIAFQRVIALAPNSAAAYDNLGVALQKLKRWQEAIAAHCQALTLDPDSFEAYNNLSVALERQNDLDAALALCRQALALQPDSAKAWSNLGVLVEQAGRTDEAIALLEQAVARDGGFTSAHFNLAVCRLRQGEFARGWEDYEWRKGGLRGGRPLPVPQPYWNGEALAGRTLLLHAEQGLGDTLQFVRYLKPLAAQGGRLVLVVPPPLARLLRRLPHVTVLTPDEVLPAFDFHLPLLSLPRIFATRPDTIPGEVPYLMADPADVKRWCARLEADNYAGRLKVGVVWSGNPDHNYDRQRSMAAAEILPALQAVPGVQLFSLQKELRAADRAVVAACGDGMIDLAADFRDFADTAAALSALDLVIAVDTSIVHLAGALARPVWTLLPFVADWRWQCERTDSLWYPTMRLFRQPRRGDWACAVAQVRAALAQVSQAHGTTATR